jgi:hypothetical protein
MRKHLNVLGLVDSVCVCVCARACAHVRPIGEELENRGGPIVNVMGPLALVPWKLETEYCCVSRIVRVAIAHFLFDMLAGALTPSSFSSHMKVLHYYVLAGSSCS